MLNKFTSVLVIILLTGILYINGEICNKINTVSNLDEPIVVKKDPSSSKVSKEIDPKELSSYQILNDGKIMTLLYAIKQVESSGGKNLIGDNGKSIGPYQISEAYWKDATEFSDLGGSYQDCMSDNYSRMIIFNYWNRYMPDDATFEDLARIHNGGPTGHKKDCTKIYWDKIQEHLNF